MEKELMNELLTTCGDKESMEKLCVAIIIHTNDPIERSTAINCLRVIGQEGKVN